MQYGRVHDGTSGPGGAWVCGPSCAPSGSFFTPCLHYFSQWRILQWILQFLVPELVDAARAVPGPSAFLGLLSSMSATGGGSLSGGSTSSSGGGATSAGQLLPAVVGVDPLFAAAAMQELRAQLARLLKAVAQALGGWLLLLLASISSFCW